MSRLDQTLLVNVKQRSGGGITARCPACFQEGHDKTGNHLVIFPSGTIACIQYPHDEGVEHRKRIFALVGVPDKPVLQKGNAVAFSTIDLAIASQERRLKMKATRRDFYNRRTNNIDRFP